MAYYGDIKYLERNSNEAFGKVNEPGTAAPYSGIYRCDGCGHEAVSTHGHPLPPQNHHQHSAAQGKIRWRLIVAATHH